MPIFLAYLRLFLINVVTPPLFFLLFPARASITTIMAINHNWFMVTLVAAVGGTIGLLFWYYLSRRINQMVKNAKQEKNIIFAIGPRRWWRGERIDRGRYGQVGTWGQGHLTTPTSTSWSGRLLKRLRHNLFMTIVVINILPVPDPASALLARTQNYPLRLFVVAATLGRFLHTLPISFAVGRLGSIFPQFSVTLKSVEQAIMITSAYVIFALIVIALIFRVVRRRRQKLQSTMK